jgi:hypothetical protein
MAGTAFMGNDKKKFGLAAEAAARVPDRYG